MTKESSIERPPACEAVLAPGLRVEDTGDSIFLVSEGNGHDLTLSIEPEVATILAEFIMSRRRAP